jgi:Domain of unknown function (DUF1841)
MSPADNDDDIDGRYDADEAPAPEAWLAMDEQARLDAVTFYHLEGPHAPAPSPEAHAAFHVVVENQIATGMPPATGATLSRLVAEGLTRHEAVHAVAGAASRRVFDMLQAGQPFDAVAYETDLGHLSAASWLASAVGGPASIAPRRLTPKRKRRSHR